ncbi:SWIB-domain-containing protein [Rhizophagus clarus]|uniref:SWIB-domain-containing protein n=1 Tax=Rhizophagus clarus TaxID=94130 RepID=A0A8H3QYD4_9GLOM|nr:SWIB-domain-containing protein [Rhizophagus clarus]
MTDVTDVNISKYIPTINRILLGSDPNEITARDVRMQLQQEYNVDLSPLKLEVQNLIEQCFDDLEIGDEVEEPIRHKVPKKQKKNSNSEKKSSIHKPSKKSGARGRPPKSQVKIRESDYSSLEDDSPPQKKKRGRKPKGSSVKAESSDAEYERKFEEELLNETNGKKSKSKNNGTSKKKSNKRKKRDDEEHDGEGPKKRKKGNTGIHKPLILSSVLAEFLQAEEMSRLEVVKRLWAYIKENELQDPNDKRYIVCDERLMTIFQQNRIHSFTMNKFLTVHLKKKEVSADADADADADVDADADADVKSINGEAANHYENRSVSGDNDLDDVSRDEDIEDDKVKMEPQENWADLDNLDNEDNDDLFEDDDDSEWVKQEDDDDKSQE